MRQLITIIAVSVFSLYLMNAEAQELPDNMPAPDTAEPIDPFPPQEQPPQGEPVPEDYDPQPGTDATNQSNILGSNYNGSHVQGGMFINGDSNSSTRVINPSMYQGYVGSTPLVASPGTCFGSKNHSISAPGIGLTRSKTKIDKHCNRRNNLIMNQNNMRANVEILKQLGLNQAAMTMMCQQDPAVRQALKSSLQPKQYIMVCGTQNEKEAFQRDQETEELIAMLKQPAVEPAPAPKPAASTERFHTVAQGDTLWRISGGSQAGYQRILELNPELTPNTIEVGQSIRIN